MWTPTTSNTKNMGGDGLRPIPKKWFGVKIKHVWNCNLASRITKSVKFPVAQVHSTHIPGTYIYIYCLLVGGYMIPTTYSQNRARKLSNIDKIIWWGISISCWPQVLNPAAFWMSTKKNIYIYTHISKSNIPAPFQGVPSLNPKGWWKITPVQRNHGRHHNWKVQVFI